MVELYITIIFVLSSEKTGAFRWSAPLPAVVRYAAGPPPSRGFCGSVCL